MKKSHGIGETTCKHCSETFQSSQLLNEHLDQVHGALFKCEKCGLSFQSNTSLLNHAASHKGKFISKVTLSLVILTTFEFSAKN